MTSTISFTVQLLPSFIYPALQLLKGAKTAKSVVGLHAAGPCGRCQMEAFFCGAPLHPGFQERRDAGVPGARPGEHSIRFIASLKYLFFPVCKIHARRAAFDQEAGSPHVKDSLCQRPDVLLHADDRGHIPACCPGHPLLIAGSVRHKADLLRAGDKVVHIGEHFFQEFPPVRLPCV